MRERRWLWVYLALLFLAAAVPAFACDPTTEPASPPEPARPAFAVPPDELMMRGAESYRHGQFSDAVRLWRGADNGYAASRQSDRRCDSLANLAMAYEALGQYARADTALHDAMALSEPLHDSRLSATLLGSMATLYTFTRRFDDADDAIARGLESAGHADPASAARLHIDLGNLRTCQRRWDEADLAYQQAGDEAANAHDHLLTARALADAALSAGRSDDTWTDPALSGRGAPGGARGLEIAQTRPAPAGGDNVALDLCNQAMTDTTRLPAGDERAKLLLTIGRAYEQVAQMRSGSDAAAIRRREFDACSLALADATLSGDQLTRSYALGAVGHLYEAQGRIDEALQLTRRAALLAEAARAPHALYRWQWQTGRLLAAAGKEEQAIASYQAAVTTLQPLQNDLVFGYGNHGPEGSFREMVAPVFYQLSDLLLRRADSARGEADVQRALHDARQVIESLKSGELQDYFQDPCVNLLKSRVRPVESVESRTAVVYIIPLADRTEILIGFGPDLLRVRVPVGAIALDKEVHEFRVNLQDRASNACMDNARRLYDWLIRPIDPLFQSRKIDTLVFVPDGALRSVPLSALHDGREFLIARYAVAVTPGLTLMDPRPIPRVQGAVLGAGISESVSGFPALAAVPEELAGVHKLFGGDELLDRQFVKPALRRELTEHDFSILHIASHAQFSGDIRQTFLLTYDGRLTLDELGQYIEPSRFRERPLELVTLSACQTATGDDRAALGLAGAAIKAGARSVVGSLWSVSDEASGQLVKDFYSQLRADPTLTKAKALQRAQLKLMEDERFRHPCYWSPFLVIGNWL